jgi:hypothetical protein
MKKRCAHCKLEKDVFEFAINRSKPDGLQLICKSCTSIYNKKWYLNNKAHHKVASNQRRHKRKAVNRKYLLEYLETHHCVDCGESRKPCLDFDHVKGKKHKAISEMMDRSLSTLKKEIAKCVVRCANCHRIKTAKDQGWFTAIDD